MCSYLSGKNNVIPCRWFALLDLMGVKSSLLYVLLWHSNGPWPALEKWLRSSLGKMHQLFKLYKFHSWNYVFQALLSKRVNAHSQHMEFTAETQALQYTEGITKGIHSAKLCSRSRKWRSDECLCIFCPLSEVQDDSLHLMVSYFDSHHFLPAERNLVRAQ